MQLTRRRDSWDLFRAHIGHTVFHRSCSDSWIIHLRPQLLRMDVAPIQEVVKNHLVLLTDDVYPDMWVLHGVKMGVVYTIAMVKVLSGYAKFKRLHVSHHPNHHTSGVLPHLNLIVKVKRSGSLGEVGVPSKYVEEFGRIGLMVRAHL